MHWLPPCLSNHSLENVWTTTHRSKLVRGLLVIFFSNFSRRLSSMFTQPAVIHRPSGTLRPRPSYSRHLPGKESFWLRRPPWRRSVVMYCGRRQKETSSEGAMQTGQTRYRHGRQSMPGVGPRSEEYRDLIVPPHRLCRQLLHPDHRYRSTRSSSKARGSLRGLNAASRSVGWCLPWRTDLSAVRTHGRSGRATGAGSSRRHSPWGTVQVCRPTGDKRASTVNWPSGPPTTRRPSTRRTSRGLNWHRISEATSSAAAAAA